MAGKISLREERQAMQKQTQRMMMLPKMQQALHMLQLPVMELANLIEDEMEQNPILEYAEAQAPMEDTIEERSSSSSGDEEGEMDFEAQNFEILQRLDQEIAEHFSQDEGLPQKLSSEEYRRKSYFDSILQYQGTLQDHILDQIRATFDLPERRQAAEILLGYFDENGFISNHLEEG